MADVELKTLSKNVGGGGGGAVQQDRRQLKRALSQAEKKFQKHSCTDVPCLLIFICFVAAWFYIAAFSLRQGDFSKAIIPVDSNNRKCGLDSGVRDKKHLLFSDIDKCIKFGTLLDGCSGKQICVEKCPTEYFNWDEELIANRPIDEIKAKLICDPEVDKAQLHNFNDINETISKENCFKTYFKSKPIFNYCFFDIQEKLCKLLRDPKSRVSREIATLNVTELMKKVDLENFCKQKGLQPKNHAAAEVNTSGFGQFVAVIITKFFSTNSKDAQAMATDITEDLANSYKVVAVAIILNLIVAVLFIVLLRWLAKPLLWFAILGALLLLSFILYYSIRQYNAWTPIAQVQQHGVNLKAYYTNVIRNPDFWYWLSIVIGIVLLVIFLIVLMLRKRINIAITLIRESSKAISSIKSTIFFPVFPGILYILVTCAALFVLLQLQSIGEYTFRVVKQIDTTKFPPQEMKENCVCQRNAQNYTTGASCNPKIFDEYCHLAEDSSKACIITSCSFQEISHEPKVKWFIYYNIFGFFWATSFIAAYKDMVLACTFSLWYWTLNKKNLSKMPLLKGIFFTTLYHMGTLAFGSLILAICRMIRYGLDLMQKKLKLYDNALTRALLTILKCAFWCLENFLKFLNRNAYIVCAIHSTNFCSSSKKAFTLIMENCLRVFAIEGVTAFLFFLSKLFITSSTCVTIYFSIENFPKFFGIHDALIPTVLVGIVAWIMTGFIFTTYSMAVDTLFICFLEDSSENDGSIEKPYFMSKRLGKLLRKRNTLETQRSIVEMAK